MSKVYLEDTLNKEELEMENVATYGNNNITINEQI